MIFRVQEQRIFIHNKQVTFHPSDKAQLIVQLRDKHQSKVRRLFQHRPSNQSHRILIKFVQSIKQQQE